MIFGKGRVKKDKYNVMDNKRWLKIWDSLKHTGVLFNFNGKFFVAMRKLLEQASKAMDSVLNISIALSLPIDIQLQFFKTLGYEDIGLLEKLHLKFCKYILGVRNSPPTVMVYGELASYAIYISVKCKIIGYWLRLLSSEESNPS